jgi:tripartite-type tricarboxylate transporter receptor subunit TctC
MIALLRAALFNLVVLANLAASIASAAAADYPNRPVRWLLTEIGGIPKPMTPAEFGRLVADETEKWRKAIEFAGVSVE